MAIDAMRGLRLHRGTMVDPEAYAAYGRLLSDVLGVASVDTVEDRWTSFALFDQGGRCVANVDATALELVLDGRETQASGIRSVAVDPAWRGRGLFRTLMDEALGWCAPAEPTLLYTADPSLYARFGFRTVPQHAFAGPPPAPSPKPPARRLDLGDASDRAIVRALWARRVPVSTQCALGIGAELFMSNVAKDDALALAVLQQPEVLIVYEADDADLIIADIVGPEIPDLATILGGLGQRPSRVTVLFPTDKLAWHGTAEPEETGLMIRGSRANAMTRPFMFPPTSEF